MFVNKRRTKVKNRERVYSNMQKREQLCFCYSMLKASYFCNLLVSFSTVRFNYHRCTHKIKRSFYPLEEKNLILFMPKKIPFKITS